MPYGEIIILALRVHVRNVTFHVQTKLNKKKPSKLKPTGPLGATITLMVPTENEFDTPENKEHVLYLFLLKLYQGN